MEGQSETLKRPVNQVSVNEPDLILNQKTNVKRDIYETFSERHFQTIGPK